MLCHSAVALRLHCDKMVTDMFILQNRSIEEDLRSMICADGLGLARSSLADFVGFHSKSKRIYGPRECNYRLNRIALFRQEVQVRAENSSFFLVV